MGPFWTRVFGPGWARFGRGLPAVNAPASVTIPVTGYYIALGYFITGEVVERRTTVVPLRRFDFVHRRFGPGAVEVFCRYSQLNISDRIFSDGLADARLWTNTAMVTDTGANWYLNRYIKFYFDWQHSEYGSPVLLNATPKLSKHDDLYWVRCQIYF